MASFFPETIAPTVPLSKDLESLFEFLAHQKPGIDREFNELAQRSEKELDAKIRELENWNFRLNLDEGALRRPCWTFLLRCGGLTLSGATNSAKEMQDSISLGIAGSEQQQQQKP